MAPTHCPAKEEWQAAVAEENARLNEALGKTIRYAIRDTTIRQFAESVHYQRPALNSLLNQKATDNPQKNWTLSLLLAVARSLNVRLSTIIAEAEDVMEGGAPGMHIRLASTEPGTRERLQKLIYAAVGYSGDLDEKEFDGVLEVLYRVKDVEYAVPAFWESYRKGFMGDQEALRVLNSAVRIQGNAAKEDAPPFWEALRLAWEEFPAPEEAVESLRHLNDRR